MIAAAAERLSDAGDRRDRDVAEAVVGCEGASETKAITRPGAALSVWLRCLAATASRDRDDTTASRADVRIRVKGDVGSGPCSLRVGEVPEFKSGRPDLSVGIRSSGALAASSRSLAVCRLGLGSLSVDRDEVGVADVMVGERLPVGEVTLLFSDVEGSTRLLHEIGELFGEVLAEHDRVLREVWAAFGGAVVKTEGDAFFVAFGDAEAAVAAAEAAQRALAGHRWPHRGSVLVRMGVHTGRPRLRGDDYWGIDVHYAARLCSAASGGQVLLSSSTRTLVPEATVDDLGEHALKDFSAPRRLFHLRVDGRGAAQFSPPRTVDAAAPESPVAA